MSIYQIAFWNPGYSPKGNNIFGCSTLGFFDEDKWSDPAEDKSVIWKSLEGEVFSGSCSRMLEECKKTDIKPVAILAFLKSDVGNDGFVDALQEIFVGVPILGGTAAKTDSMEEGEVLPEGEHGALMLITEGKYATDFICVHEHSLGRKSCKIENNRIIREIEGRLAAEYLSDIRKELNKPENDFESLTFHESCKKNVHCCSYEASSVYAGANLEETDLELSEIKRADADGVISKYMRKKHTLSIGCAGLKSLLTTPFKGEADNVGVFLFGEIVPYGDGRSRFSNLMLTNLTTTSF